MKSYDYIVFDVDGTLLDTEYSIIKSLQRLVFQMQGRTIREEYEKGVVSRGLGDYFETVVCCDDTARHKPNPEPMLFYLSQSKASPKQVLYVGDSIYDMKCAEAAGVHGALALWGGKSREQIQAEYYLKKPTELLK